MILKVVKANFHIVIIYLLSIAAIVLAIYLIRANNGQQESEVLIDSTKINQAYEVYERIHKQQLIEDTDYAELLEENENLKEALQTILGNAEDMEDVLIIFEEQGIDVSEAQDLTDEIINICKEIGCPTK